MSVDTIKPLEARPGVRPANGKRLRWRWYLPILAALVIAGGLSWYTHKRKLHADHTRVSTVNSGHDAKNDDAVVVRAVRLAPGGITRTSSQIGSVHPYEVADLFAKVSGYLDKLHVNYGDHVKRDQVLAEIEVPEVAADAEKAKADVRLAKAAVDQAEANVAAAKADREAIASAVDQAEAEVARYVAMKNYHAKKLERYRHLVLSKAIPQEIADEEEEDLESAKSNEEASRKAVLKSKADVIAADARVRKAEADLEEARANVAVAEAKQARADALLAYTKVVSPYDGVVTKRNFFRGAFIRSAAEGETLPLLTVERTDMVYVVTEIPDRDVPLTDVGDPAEVTVDALGTRVFKGKVSRIAEAQDPNTRTMHTEIDLPNADNQLRSGMSGIATVFLDSSRRSSTLPATCLVGESRGGKANVYVMKKNKAVKAQIEIGLDDGLRVEVLSGLSPDDEVILQPGSVTEGATVRKNG